MLAVGLWSILPSAQTQVFRTRIDLATVEVTVIDNRTGKPVTDLTARDFTVAENGAKQEIKTFAQQLLGASSDEAGSVQPNADPAPSGSQRRLFMLVFGRPRLEGPIRPYEGAQAFIRQRLLPQDMVSIMAFNRFTEFTADREAAAALVGRLKRDQDQQYYYVRMDAPMRGVRRDIRENIQAGIDSVMTGDGPLKVRSATDLILGSPAFTYSNTWRAWNQGVLNSDALKVYAAIEHLRRMDGEKHLVLFTTGITAPIVVRIRPPGLFHQDRNDDARLAARANDAGVALDIVNVTGVDFVFDRTGNKFISPNTTPIQSLQVVAELSGGMYSGTRVAEQALGRLDDVSRTGYMLGYMPANPEMDGKYRKVEVAVNRQGVTVLYRHGYTARPDIEPADLREITTNTRISEASATDLRVIDIKVEVKAAADAAARAVRVELQIDASRLSLEKKGDRYTGEIDVVILCGDSKQQVIGTLKQRMTLGMDEAHYEQAIATGIPYTVSIPVTGEATAVKVLVYDYAADIIGSALTTVKKP